MPDAIGGTSRILVVDDQEANVRLLERILVRAGYVEVRTTTDPRTVESLVDELAPDLILLDLQMPHIDGHQLLTRLAPRRAQAGYLPVLVLTADADLATRHRALEAGANDFVTKPFDADEVLLRCRNLLETRALYRQLHDHSATLELEALTRTDELSRVQHAHEEIIASLGRLETSSSLEQTAEHLCGELARSPEFDVVAVLAFEHGQTVVPVAAAGQLDVSGVLNLPLPTPRGERLIARATDGPWAARWTASPDDGHYGEVLAKTGLRCAWYAPLVSEGRAVGLIVAGVASDLPEDELARRLPALVEFSAVARALVAPLLVARRVEACARSSLLETIAHARFHPVFQPIVNVGTAAPIGFEALTRFDDGQRPDARFAEAQRLGVGRALEEVTLGAALRASGPLPPHAFLSLNVSPAILGEAEYLAELLTDVRRLVVLEVTEHEAIEDYAPLHEAMVRLGPQVRLAIDDAGAGFASFRHILELQPDFVKLDRDLVHDIHTDASRQALIVGMRYFAQKTGCTLISEGIETDAERGALLELGVEFGQGYLFGRPAPLEARAEASTSPPYEPARA